MAMNINFKCPYIADDHDVKQFLTHSLYPPGSMTPPVGAEPQKPEEQMKLSEEYNEYQRKLDIQKEQWVHAFVFVRTNWTRCQNWWRC